MKMCQTFIVLAFAISIASCRKESAQQSLSNAATQDNSAASADQLLQSFAPANFVTGIDNPYLPLVPGTVFHYVNTIKDGNHLSNENIDVTVTSDIKVILGVNCEVIHDVVKEKGTITEDTYDWYAQDKRGNVWYFGEDTKKLTDTGWSTAGSWEAGVNNARQGIAMYADPGMHIGKTYYQEYEKDVAEDRATVISANMTTSIRLGTFRHCVETNEFTRLDPGASEQKYYAPGIGQILVLQTDKADEREELVSISHH